MKPCTTLSALMTTTMDIEGVVWFRRGGLINEVGVMWLILLCCCCCSYCSNFGCMQWGWNEQVVEFDATEQNST